MAITDEIKQETQKMKEMPLKGKAAYVWEYYKIPIIGTIAGILFLSLFIRDWVNNNKPTYLHALFINSNFIYEDTSTIEADYAAREEIDLEKNNLYIDFSMQMLDDGYDQLTLGNQQKIMALYASGELDSVIGPEDVIATYADVEAYADLEALLPDDIKQLLSDKGYEYYDYSYEGTTLAIGVFLDNCEYLNMQGIEGTFPEVDQAGKRPIFTIAANAQNPEHAVELLRMMITD
ncbi:MAG: hypothetical protein QM697_00750 [Lachnospiraceae bacterium]